MSTGPANESVVSPDGVRIAVHALSAQGPELLLAHATGFHGRVWQPVADRLADRFSCLAPDLRGHGDSAPPAGLDFDWRGFGADVLAVVDGLALRCPVAAGHSSGATALLLAEQARPGTFAALYCFEPIVVPADPPLGRDSGSWLAQSTRRRRAVFASRAQALSRYAARPPLSDLHPSALRAYVEHGFADLPDGEVRLKCHPEHEALVYEMATAHDCFVHLARVHCPVILVRGERSEAFPAERAAAVAARLPRVSNEAHPALGHLGPLQDPPAVAASIRRAFAAS